MKIKYPKFSKYKNYCSIIFVSYLILITYDNRESRITGSEQIFLKTSSNISRAATQEAFQKIVKRKTNWLSLQGRLRQS